MARQLKWTAERKIRIVVSVLREETTMAEASRWHGVSATTISKWRDVFLEAGTAGLAAGANSGPSTREQQLEAELDELKIALGEAAAELRAWKRGVDVLGWEGLETIRVEAGVDITTTRSCEILGIPRASWYRWRGDALAGGCDGTGPWPTPAQDAIEADVKRPALDFDGGPSRDLGPAAHRRRRRVDGDGHRTMAATGCCSPPAKRALRQLTRARKAAFVTPTTRHNRIWQADFSELESLGEGTWNLAGGRRLLGQQPPAPRPRPGSGTRSSRRSPTQRPAGSSTRTASWSSPTTARRSGRDLRPVHGHPARVLHVRTRFRAPRTNGVIERTFGSFKYEHLYRRELADGLKIADEPTPTGTSSITSAPTNTSTSRPPTASGSNPPTTSRGNPPDPQPE